MGVFIKKPEAEAKIRELAERTCESITDAIERAVEERLQRLGPKEKKKGRIDRKKLAELLAYFDSLPVDDPRSADEIIGYDEHGLPK
jgi:antitoxin VapB